MKYTLIVLGLVLFALTAQAVTPTQFAPELDPLKTSAFWLGTTTRSWWGIVTDQVCLNGICRTTWPSGGGGGGSEINWTYSPLNNGAGFQYNSTNTDPAIIGRSSTTSPQRFEVYGGIYSKNFVGIGSTSPGASLVVGDLVLANYFRATSSSINVFPVASTTSFSVADRLFVAGAGTSTFSGPVNTAGLRSTGGLQITGGGVHSSSALTVTASATSSFVGGVSTGGLSSSNGVNITAGCYSVNGACLSFGGSPGGSDTQVQFNDSSTFGGDAGFTYDKTNDRFTVVNASSTALSLSNLLNVNGTGTSTFAGGTTHGLITGTGLILTGRLRNSDTGTSTFSGGISSAGLNSSSGLTVTGDSVFTGKLTSTAGTSSFQGGTFTGLNTTNGLIVSSGAVRLPLASCDTLDTDGNGQIICGSDASGGGSAGGFDFPNVLAFGNATSTTLGFFGGFVSKASSTVSATFHAEQVDVYGSGTSTFTGGVSTAGLIATNGIRVDSGNLIVDELASCDTIDTTASGKLICGSDNAAGGLTGGNVNALTYWIDGTTIAATNTPTVATIHATSTTAASQFHFASTTALSATNAWVTGRFGVATSAPGDTFGLGGNLLVSGTSTNAGLFVKSGGLRANALISCDTIDSDSEGNLKCGADASAGLSGGNANGLTYWVDGTTVAATNTPTVGTIHATSTTVASRIVMASTTAVSVTDQLFVNGGALTRPAISFIGDNNTGIYSPGADRIIIATGGVGRYEITSSGTQICNGVPASCTVLLSAGTAATPVYSFDSDTNTGMSAATADTLVLSTTGLQRFTIFPGGEVGIATTTGSWGKLNVGGLTVTNSMIATSTTDFSGIGTTSPAALFGVGGATIFGGNGWFGGNLRTTGTTTAFRFELDSDAGDIRVNGKNATSTIVLTGAGATPTITKGTNGPFQIETGTNLVNYTVMDFASTTEVGGDGRDTCAYWTITMPDSWNGGRLIARYMWTATTSSGSVALGMRAIAYADNGAIDTAMSATTTVVDTLQTTNNVHISPDSNEIVPTGSPAGGRPMVFQVCRDIRHASDTLATNVRLIQVLIEYGKKQFSD